MKNRIMKIRTIFKSNYLLTISGLTIVIIALLFLWKWSMATTHSLAGPHSVNTLLREMSEFEDDNIIENEESSIGSVKITYFENKTYLTDENDNIVFGPCGFIFDDFSYSNYDRIFRFVDSTNGLIGFGKVNYDSVDILFPAILSKATIMADGSACVQENDHYYYIDSNGKRFTRDYVTGYPFAEAQGDYARVQTDDGSWAVINRKDEVVVGSLDSINKLHYFSLIGSGIKDGKAVLFRLENYDGRQPGITDVFAEYKEIEEPCGDSDIAIVTEGGGKKGVLCVWNGEIVVPAMYEDIKWGFVDTENTEDISCQLMWFCCQKEDGTYDVKYWEFLQ